MKAQIYIILIIFIFGCTQNNVEPVKKGRTDPYFGLITKNWFPQVNKMDMSQIWIGSGINAEGENYYFLPAPLKSYSCSARFFPDADYFQCWFGMYTVKDKQSGTYAINGNELNEYEILNLGIADQKAWLSNFAGLNNPVVEIDTTFLVTKENITIDSQTGWKIKAKVKTNVDVGDNNPSDVPPLVNIKRKYWKDRVESYQVISSMVYLYVWYTPENKELNVAYFNSIDFIDLDGNYHSTPESVVQELENMVESITVYQ